MRTEEEIKKQLEGIKSYLDSVPKVALLNEQDRTTFACSAGAANILEWVLGAELQPVNNPAEGEQK